MRWMILVLACAMSGAAFARMYQWTDPDTGTPYLSGSPPAWYQTSEGGPRVQVFEDGKLIDDTQWQVSRERQAALRDQALEELEARQKAEEQRKLAEEQQAEGQATVQAAGDEVAGEEDAVAIFRALVSEWDRKRTQSGKAKEPAASGP